MKKNLLLSAALLTLLLSCGTGTVKTSMKSASVAEKQYNAYAVGFYNLENLFDTIHTMGPDGEDKNDYEFLPDGINKWGRMKYESKLRNMSTVLSQMATDRIPGGLTVVGVCEVENRAVLEDLVQQPALQERGWKIAHVDSPDPRGVDCALLYNPRQFTVETIDYPLYYHEDGTLSHTRGFLTVGGMLAGEKVHFIVNHWPSRFNDSSARERAGEQVRVIKDSLLHIYPGSTVIIMGDLNDDPDDKSVAVKLGAKRKKEDCGPNDLYNPWWKTLREDGVGTLKYDGKWNLFDQIIVSGNLVDGDRSHLQYFRNEIFLREYMLQKEGKYKGYPLRTHASGVWMNGYSDHLPTIIYLIKEKTLPTDPPHPPLKGGGSPT